MVVTVSQRWVLQSPSLACLQKYQCRLFICFWLSYAALVSRAWKPDFEKNAIYHPNTAHQNNTAPQKPGQCLFGDNPVSIEFNKTSPRHVGPILHSECTLRGYFYFFIFWLCYSAVSHWSASSDKELLHCPRKE